MLSKIRKGLFNSLPSCVLVFVLNIMPSYLFKIKKISRNVYLLIGGTDLYICRPKRLFKYKDGVNSRLSRLRDKYFIDDIDFIKGDLVIDIGSNIGEVPMAIRAAGNKISVIAIEPDVIEFQVLKKNLLESDTLYNCFLGEHTGYLYASYNNNSGDTHIVTPDHNDVRSKVLVKLHALDDLLSEINIESVKLLKLEVEGYEPEVLNGARQTLKVVQFVTVDTSPEREGKDTFDEVFVLMRELSFEMIANHNRSSVIFKNSNYIC
jgi:FkbM family methyltransferase